ncbi:pol protein [Cucumis melo var. makuwa]|uniref:Pol protein n=1 Tax=Cucumis melo var. makuwa TaxID=1194695 RepID=A0A5D3E083_CUCMM|nr:pol protein [Cucumis melo var. makuwa]TYK29194.1 pol protein [Cucumis melo var. makuwa]
MRIRIYTIEQNESLKVPTNLKPYTWRIEEVPSDGVYDSKFCELSPVGWDEVGEQRLMGPKLVQSTNEAIQKIRACMRAAQSRQKSYADVRWKDLEFDVGDKVFLKRSMKGVLRFGKK